MSIGDREYPTLEAALEAASTGDVIAVTDTVEITVPAHLCNSLYELADGRGMDRDEDGARHLRRSYIVREPEADTPVIVEKQP